MYPYSVRSSTVVDVHPFTTSPGGRPPEAPVVPSIALVPTHSPQLARLKLEAWSLSLAYILISRHMKVPLAILPCPLFTWARSVWRRTRLPST